MKNELALYRDLLRNIKIRVRQGQHRAALSANAEMIAMYWDIGRMIAARQKEEGWGTGVIPRLAADLKNELPEEKGFSERNIKRMLRFFREYSYLEAKVPQAAALLCQSKDRIYAEYALRDIHKPIGLADYELTRALPTELASNLPSIESLEIELADELLKEDDA